MPPKKDRTQADQISGPTRRITRSHSKSRPDHDDISSNDTPIEATARDNNKDGIQKYNDPQNTSSTAQHRRQGDAFLDRKKQTCNHNHELECNNPYPVISPWVDYSHLSEGQPIDPSTPHIIIEQGRPRDTTKDILDDDTFNNYSHPSTYGRIDCHYHEAPYYSQDNPSIYTGFRVRLSIKQAFRSLFQIHNDIWNVWTHLIGAFVMLGFLYLLLTSHPHGADFAYSHALGRNYINKQLEFLYHYFIPVAPLAANTLSILYKNDDNNAIYIGHGLFDSESASILHSKQQSGRFYPSFEGYHESMPIFCQSYYVRYEVYGHLNNLKYGYVPPSNTTLSVSQLLGPLHTTSNQEYIYDNIYDNKDNNTITVLHPSHFPLQCRSLSRISRPQSKEKLLSRFNTNTSNINLNTSNDKQYEEVSSNNGTTLPAILNFSNEEASIAFDTETAYATRQFFDILPHAHELQHIKLRIRKLMYTIPLYHTPTGLYNDTSAQLPPLTLSQDDIAYISSLVSLGRLDGLKDIVTSSKIKYIDDNLNSGRPTLLSILQHLEDVVVQQDNINKDRPVDQRSIELYSSVETQALLSQAYGMMVRFSAPIINSFVPQSIIPPPSSSLLLQNTTTPKVQSTSTATTTFNPSRLYANNPIYTFVDWISSMISPSSHPVQLSTTNTTTTTTTTTTSTNTTLSKTVNGLAHPILFFKYVDFGEEYDDNLPIWPIIVFLLSAITCFMCSAIFHLLSPTHFMYHKIFSRLDYAGISILIGGSNLPMIYYSFYCHKYERDIALICIAVSCLITFWVTVSPSFAGTRFRAARTAMFIILGIAGALPCVYSLVVFGNFDYVLFIYLIVMGATYIGGALIYVAQVPESCCPGHFDFCCASHMIWHLFVLTAAFIHYAGVLYAYHSRTMAVCLDPGADLFSILKF